MGLHNVFLIFFGFHMGLHHLFLIKSGKAIIVKKNGTLEKFSGSCFLWRECIFWDDVDDANSDVNDVDVGHVDGDCDDDDEDQNGYGDDYEYGLHTTPHVTQKACPWMSGYPGLARGFRFWWISRCLYISFFLIFNCQLFHVLTKVAFIWRHMWPKQDSKCRPLAQAAQWTQWAHRSKGANGPQMKAKSPISPNLGWGNLEYTSKSSENTFTS